MGWNEFCAWLEVMRAQSEPAPENPDTWAGTEGNQWWRDARAKRAAERGRG